MSTGTHFADVFYSKNAEAIEKIAEEHPMSSLSQFLLLYHYKKNNDPRFETQAKKSALHFNNLNWIQFQLVQNHLKEGKTETINPANEQKEDISFAEPEGADLLPESLPELPANEQKEEISLAKPEGVDLLPEASNGLPANVQKEEISLAKPEDVGMVPEASNELPANEQKEEISLETHGPEAVSEIEEESIPFEPLHTVDYFASQGIKIKEEMLMNDKLGRQMKSFTEWLKSMKQLHPGKLPEQNEVIEKIIQSSAEESNADANVLTEAMAEVLIKQGKKQKAVEMYQKLSLMNPAKSAYFAGKIESLKTI